MKGGYRSFTLDVSRMNYQATDQQLLSQGLQSGRQLTYGEATVIEESRLEGYIVRELINYDDVSYDDHADLIYELAGQAVVHFRSKQTTQRFTTSWATTVGPSPRTSIFRWPSTMRKIRLAPRSSSAKASCR